jgi:putative ABC transport system permease protein
MIRITLALMRTDARRLVPSALAILLGAAFIAATLLTSGVLTRTTADRLSAPLAGADLVVRSTLAADSGADLLAEVRSAPGVVAADPLLIGSVQLEHGGVPFDQTMVAAPSSPELTPVRVVAGRAPQGDDEVALPEAVADRRRLALGDGLAVLPADGGADGEPVPVELVGLLQDPRGAFSATGGAGMAGADALLAWTGPWTVPPFDTVLAVVDDVAVADGLSHRLGADVEVLTREAAAAEQLTDRTSASLLLSMLVLGFGGIALLVAALVIANTFAVLIAQRTRRLALLRIIGARRGQLGRSVLLEGTLLGAAASTVGVLVALVLGQVALQVLAVTAPESGLPTFLPVSAAVLVLPVLVGTATSAAASWLPARAAVRVSPTAALHPPAAPVDGGRGGRRRAVAAALLVVVGSVQLLLACVGALAGDGSRTWFLWLSLGLLGGAATAAGVLLGAVHWVPRAALLLGPVFSRLGPAGRFAVANTGRNPRRTAATTSALLVGVTLVAMLSTGAATARQTFDTGLATAEPVDLLVSSLPGEEWVERSPLPGDAVTAIEQVPGVGQAVGVRSAPVQTPVGTMLGYGVDPAQAATVLRDPEMAAALARGEAVVPPGLVADQVELSTAAGTVLLPAWSGPAAPMIIVPSEVLAQLAPDAPVTAAWALLEQDVDPGLVLQDVGSALASQDVVVKSPAAELVQVQQAIDLALAIALGLLGFAVLIALIGVANTLSLAVVERRGEIATVRAVGMTRRQLTGSLAAEGVMIALIGSVAGILAGVLLGWVGTTVVLGSMLDLVLVVPWTALATVAGLALAAGYLASVLPARSAARTAPAAALAG